MTQEQNINTNETKKTPGKKIRRSFIYNKWIVSNIPFYLFVATLLILYIANGHYADKT